MPPTSGSPSTGRDLRLDSLRGLFLIGMTVNHLPTTLREFTDGPVGIFSSAEGFVFLSGIIAGLVYTRKFRKGGTAALREASTGRAWTIYRWHILSFVSCLLAVRLIESVCRYCSMTAPNLFFASPLKALALGSVLLYQPGLLDLLPMYCGFVLLLPGLIPALEAGKRVQVLCLSAAVWFAVQWLPGFDATPMGPLNLGSFNLLAWQFLFVLGVCMGHSRASGQPILRRPPVVVMLGVAAVLTYGFGLRRYHWPEIWPDARFGVLLNKPALGLYRLADFGCAAYVVALVGARFPGLLTWRPLAFLGQHSLQVVTAQTVCVIALLEFPHLFATELSANVTTVATLAFLFVAAGLHAAWVRRAASRSAAGGDAARPDRGGMRRRPLAPALTEAPDARAA